MQTRLACLEVPSPKEAEVAHCLAGLGECQRWTDTAIVASRGDAGRRWLYEPVMASTKRPPHIIPGLKLHYPDFGGDNGYEWESLWDGVADEAVRIATQTGNTVVWIDGETVLKPFYAGEVNIDLDVLYVGMAPLRECGLDVLMRHPFLVGDSPNRLSGTTELTKAVAVALPNATFVTSYSGVLGWENTEDAMLRRMMIELVGGSRIIELQYPHITGCFDGGKQAYLPRDAIASEWQLLGDEHVIYPSAAEWVPVCRAYADLLAATT